MSNVVRDLMTKDLQRALAIVADVKKRARYGKQSDPRIEQRLAQICGELAETVTIIHGPQPKLAVGDMMSA